MPPLGTGTLWSRNITTDPETGIGKWTEEQIYTTLKTMVRPDGRMIHGPMLFMQGPWSQLDDADIQAVAAYIKQLPPVKNKVPESTFKPNAGPPPGACAFPRVAVLFPRVAVLSPRAAPRRWAAPTRRCLPPASPARSSSPGRRAVPDPDPGAVDR